MFKLPTSRRHDDRPSARRPARRPMVEGLEGRQLLSTVVADTGVDRKHVTAMIQGAHIGSAMIQGAHIGSSAAVVSDGIIGRHIG
jgi:hypothetical protein